MRYENSILTIINNTSEHMTAEQVFLTLKQTYPSLVLATVYNNLNKLCQQKKIRKISTEGLPDRYDRTIRHDHLICSQCGKLSDIFLCDITSQLEDRVGFPILGYDLKIKYLCPECRYEQTNHSITNESNDSKYKGGL